jgi:hypothetical protein
MSKTLILVSCLKFKNICETFLQEYRVELLNPPPARLSLSLYVHKKYFRNSTRKSLRLNLYSPRGIRVSVFITLCLLAYSIRKVKICLTKLRYF